MALYLGLMSGTSMDSVDAALVDIGPDGFNLVCTHEHPFPADIGARVSELMSGGATARLGWHTDAEVGKLFAEAALRLLERAGIAPARVDAIGSHGQTVYHAPADAVPCTVQIGDPNIIAYRTGITTVADFRRMDMAAGGQGAPLAPAFHAHAFGSREAQRGVINIGGIANLSILPAGQPEGARGFDTGPGNTLLDVWAQRHIGAPHDHEGQWAATGKPIPALLETCLEAPFFSITPPKSTGRELFNLDWLGERIEATSSRTTNFAPNDVQSTLSELTVESIARACERFADGLEQLWICGGGAYNKDLLTRLAARLPSLRIGTTAELGIEPAWVEAVAFAWLAQRRLDGRPGNLPAVTGAETEVLLGGVYRP